MTTYFDGPLGVQYSESSTTLTVWVPKALCVSLIDVATGNATEMASIDNGAWTIVMDGDFHGFRYRYRIEGFRDGKQDIWETTDPWCHGSTANGEASVVLDPARCGEPVERLEPFASPGHAIIYEAHVRDLTIHPNNRISQPGTFAGLTEYGTTTTRNNPSGVDHIASLGITHLQLLPIYDFETVDEAGDLSFGAQYNWGYDPYNHNVVEGSYSTNPHDPTARIQELKDLVRALHNRGIRVIMDVVYNHVYSTSTSPLGLTADSAYFRRTADGHYHNGTGVGNETASEHPMMRRYIVESVAWWAEEFGLDGFRFDLMGIHDVETMRQVRERLNEIDPSIIVLGEGWEMGNHPAGVIPSDHRAAKHLDGIAFFNDAARDLIKGPVFAPGGTGFVTTGGDDAATWLVWNVLTGSRALREFARPDQAVNYVEAHDNHTLRDTLRFALPHAPEREMARRHMLATTIMLLSPGIAFLHAGQEVLRSKGGDGNSYQAPDYINAMDLSVAARPLHSKVNALVKGMIAWRKKTAALQPEEFSDIDRTHRLESISPGRLSFRILNEDSGSSNYVYINANNEDWDVDLPSGSHQVIVHNHEMADPDSDRIQGELRVPTWSVTIVETAPAPEEPSV